MVLVFTAVILFFTILFWTIERFNRVARQGQACKLGNEDDR
ncbi:MAG TPA: hypothetical protein VFT90_10455 [Chryseosolibacter sp.]|nr:hypothetical protein [Chryseosolibacter sp.]